MRQAVNLIREAASLIREAEKQSFPRKQIEREIRIISEQKYILNTQAVNFIRKAERQSFPRKQIRLFLKKNLTDDQIKIAYNEYFQPEHEPEVSLICITAFYFL